MDNIKKGDHVEMWYMSEVYLATVMEVYANSIKICSGRFGIETRNKAYIQRIFKSS